MGAASNQTEEAIVRYWGFGAAFLVLVSTLGAASLASIPDLMIGDANLMRRIAGQLASMVVQNAVFVAVPVVILALLLGVRPGATAFGFRPPARPFLAAGVVALAFGVYVLLSAGMGVLLGVGDRTDTLPVTLGAAESTASGIAIALAVTILAPVGEEFLMRGVVFPGMRDGARVAMPMWAAVALAATINGVIFGAMHGATEPIFIPMLVLFGVILCLLYQVTGSLYAPIALHLTNNTVAIATALNWSVVEAVALWMVAAGVLLGVAQVAARAAGARQVG